MAIVAGLVYIIALVLSCIHGQHVTDSFASLIEYDVFRYLVLVAGAIVALAGIAKASEGIEGKTVSATMLGVVVLIGGILFILATFKENISNLSWNIVELIIVSTFVLVSATAIIYDAAHKRFGVAIVETLIMFFFSVAYVFSLLDGIVSTLLAMILVIVVGFSSIMESKREVVADEPVEEKTVKVATGFSPVSPGIFDVSPEKVIAKPTPVKEEPKPEVKPEPKPAKVEPKAKPAPAVVAAPKEEPKPEVKSEPKSEPAPAKVEPKPAKVEPEAKPAPAVVAAPKEEPKPEVKPEPKPAKVESKAKPTPAKVSAKKEPKPEPKPAKVEPVKEKPKEEPKPAPIKEELSDNDKILKEAFDKVSNSVGEDAVQGMDDVSIVTKLKEIDSSLYAKVSAITGLVAAAVVAEKVCEKAEDKSVAEPVAEVAPVADPNDAILEEAFNTVSAAVGEDAIQDMDDESIMSVLKEVDIDLYEKVSVITGIEAETADEKTVRSAWNTVVASVGEDAAQDMDDESIMSKLKEIDSALYAATAAITGIVVADAVIEVPEEDVVEVPEEELVETDSTEVVLKEAFDKVSAAVGEEAIQDMDDESIMSVLKEVDPELYGTVSEITGIETETRDEKAVRSAW
ncbi:MAG: hypothetical protein MJZ68_03480, partial [archaeon]|nr:hypothetical protein [archaeon]